MTSTSCAGSPQSCTSQLAHSSSEMCACSDRPAISESSTMLASFRHSPLTALGPELFTHLLGVISEEPTAFFPSATLDVGLNRGALSSDGLQRLLPLLLSCRAHYHMFKNSVYGLSVIPIGFPRLKRMQCISKTGQVLRLSRYYKIASTSIPATVSSFPNLRRLELSRVVDISDQSFHKIVLATPNLKALRAVGHSKLTSSGVHALCQACPLLESLDLAYCITISDDAAKSLAKMKLLKTLRASRWDVTDVFVEVLAAAPVLKVLDLLSCINLGNESLKALAAKAKYLSKLNMRGCRRVTDAGLKALSENRNLEFVDFSFIDSISDIGVCNLAKMPKLHTMKLSQCASLSDSCSSAIAKSSLQILKLSWCLVTDVTLQNLSQSNTLQSVNFSGCAQISDAGVIHLAEIWTLTSIKVTSCDRLSDRSVLALAKKRGFPLQMLDVRRCEKITEDALNIFENNCKVLFSNGVIYNIPP